MDLIAGGGGRCIGSACSSDFMHTMPPEINIINVLMFNTPNSPFQYPCLNAFECIIDIFLVGGWGDGFNESRERGCRGTSNFLQTACW